MNDQMLAYVDLVLRFRKVLNLTSISSPNVFNTRFVEPSTALAEFLPETGRMLDIGSGMGVPGIPLLICKPGLHGVLVERRKKRAEFLKHVVRELGLSAEVYGESVEDLDCLHVDVCVARAVTRVKTLLDMCEQHVNSGAVAVFPVPREQLDILMSGWKLEADTMVSAGESQRVLKYQWEGVSRET